MIRIAKYLVGLLFVTSFTIFLDEWLPEKIVIFGTYNYPTRAITFAIDALIVTAIVTAILNYFRAQELKSERKLAFATLLENAQGVDDTLINISKYLVNFFGIQHAMIESILDEVREKEEIVDGEGDGTSEIFVEKIRDAKEELRNIIGPLDLLIPRLEHQIFIIDDTIEAHINVLNSEASFFANSFRTEIRKLHYLVSGARNDLRTMIESINENRGKDVATQISEIHKRIKLITPEITHLNKDNSDEIDPKLKRVNALMDEYFGDSSPKKVFLQLKEAREIEENMKEWSRVLKSFVTGIDVAALGKKKVKNKKKSFTYNGKQFDSGQYYMIRIKNTKDKYKYLYLDGLERRSEEK